MTLWIGFKQHNFASDESIGPNEEEFDTLTIFKKELKARLF